MAYDETLASRARSILEQEDGFSEKKMFGGLCFLINGSMTAGVIDDRLMVRVGKERYEEALGYPHCHEMDFTGRPMTGMVIVEPEGLTENDNLNEWLVMGISFTSSLPPK